MASLRVVLKCDEYQGEDDSHWMEHLLDAVSVRSYLRGRIRYHLGFKGDEVLADTLRRELRKVDSVRLEAYSVRTRNALVSFNPAVVTDLEVTAALLRGVREFGRLHGECDLEHHHHDHRGHDRPKRDHDRSDHAGHGAMDCEEKHDEECDHDHSATSTDAGIRKELLKLTVTGAVLGFVVYRKLKDKPIAFAGNPLLDIASVVTILSGYPIFRAGVDSIQRRKRATDDTLISIAVVATLLMGESLTGLSVVWLINLGRLLEAITLKRSRTAIKELMGVAPAEAWLVVDEKGAGRPAQSVRTAVERIERGQAIRVFEAEKVPLDGRVLRGRGLVREAFITGEALAREKQPGDTVYAGSLLEQGEIDLEVTNLVHDTVVARMIDAIENVRDRKAPIEQVGTRFASQFVPISLGLSAVTLLFTGDLRRAITMLVIACPCAAGLATPTAVSASIGQAARKGILIKGGTHIEMAAGVDTLVFDKTGTLTLGAPVLHRFVASEAGDERGEAECLRLAASAEQHTTHPLGLVLVNEARHRGLNLVAAEEYKIHSGLGISARVEGRRLDVGNRRFMEARGVEVPRSVESEALRGFSAGESLVFLAADQALLGAYLVQDLVRPEASDALARLRSLGIRRVLLASGDQKIAAERVGAELGIREIHSELLPAEKLALISRLKAEGCRVAMVGDGVNDAQALAEADVSIAMGGGHCDIAIETADVTLARNDLLLVAEVFEVSQKTLRAIYQNFAASVGINAGGMAFSAFGKLSPFSAAIVHNASTIAVVVNSLRLGKQVAGSSPLRSLGEVRI